MASKEVVPVPKNTGTPAPYEGWGEVPPWAYGPPVPTTDRPEWLEAVPPHNVDNKWEHGFAMFMRYPRIAALLFLKLTSNVWMFGAASLIVILVWLLLASR